MKRLWILAAFLFLAAPCFPQQGNTLIILFPGVPTGNCAPIMLGINESTGDLYDCFSGTWNKVTGGGGGGTTTNALTGDSSGSGAASGSTFNGSAAVTFSYNTFGAAPTASPIFTGTVTLPSTTVGPSLTTTTIVGGQNASASAATGDLVLQGSNQTGTGSASSLAGGTAIYGGNNAATNASSNAGSIYIEPGQSTGSTQGQQGLLMLHHIYVKGGGTSTQWNLQCPTGAAMTVNDCSASPVNVIGIAHDVNTNTVSVHQIPSQTPVNASPAVSAVGHTVCAGSVGGKVTDSGGTGICTSSQGVTVGVILATAGTWTLPNGEGTFTVSTTLPLISMGVNGYLPTSAGFALPVTVSGTTASGGILYENSTTSVSSSATLTANAVVIGGGSGGSPSTISAATTTTYALFATATAPAFRAIAAGDLPIATISALGIMEVGTGLSVASGVVTPTFGTATNQVAQGGVITAGGPTGSATSIPVITYNAAGQLTTVTTATPTVAAVNGVSFGGAAAGQVPQATSSSASSWTYTPTLGDSSHQGTLTLSDGGTLTMNGSSSGSCALTVNSTASTLSLCGTSVTPANLLSAASPTQYGVMLGAGTQTLGVTAAAGGANFPLISQSSANPIWSSVTIPTAAVTQGGLAYSSTTTAISIGGALTQYGVVVAGAVGSAPQSTSAAASGTLLQGTAANNPSFTATPTLGIVGSVAGTLALCPSTGSNCITLSATNTTGASVKFAFPTSNGSNTNVLQTDGSGNTSWVAGGSFTAGGDLSGTGSSQEVIGLLSNPLPSISTGYLNWTGSAWALTALAGGGNVTTGTLTSGDIVQASGATAIVNSSPLLDNGNTTANTLTYAGTGGISSASYTSTGSGTGGFFKCTAGSANGHATTSAITFECPSSVTAYEIIQPSAAGTGLHLWSNSSNVVTESVLSGASNMPLIGQGASVLPIFSSVAIPTSAVTQGGLVYSSTTTALSVGGALTQYGVVLAGAVGSAPVSTAQGASSMPLVGQGAANPIFGAVAIPISAVTQGGLAYSSTTTALSVGGALTQYGVVLAGAVGSAPVSTAQGGSNFPLIGQGAANPIFSTIAYPSSLAANQLLWASTTTAITGGGVNLTWATPTLTIGVAGTTTGILKIASVTATGSVSLTPASSSSAFTATLPANSGTVAELNLAQSWTAAQTIGSGGSLKASALIISPTAPTIATGGCGNTGATIAANNGTAAFTIGTGTTPTSSGCTVTMPAATTGWVCDANTVSATSTTNFLVKQTGAVSTTSVTIQNFNDTGAAAAFAGSDTIRVKCLAY